VVVLLDNNIKIQGQSDPYASALAGATGVAGLFGQIYGKR